MYAVILFLSLVTAVELQQIGHNWLGGNHNHPSSHPIEVQQRQQQNLLLMKIEKVVAIMEVQEESSKFNISSTVYSNRSSESFLTDSLPTVRGGEASDAKSRARRKFVKKMMKHAWGGYAAYAWGKNEVRPVSKLGNSGTIFGASDAGATIVDAMDTLYIMGMDEEFAKGKEWIAANLDLARVMKKEVNVFEINIRYVGGLLSLFALTGEELFKDKAVEIADKLLPAFNTPTGIPFGKIDLQTGLSSDWKMSILSEFGTLHMEFCYLSDITGNTVYKEKVDAIRSYLNSKDKPRKLYPNFLHPVTGGWGQDHSSVGALGDSFYEYLLKEWLRTGKTDELSKNMFEEAVDNIEQKLLKNSTSGQLYLADWRGGLIDHKMDHLACFAGGMFGLAARNEAKEVNQNRWMEIAKGITQTCHESYEGTATKLGPEVIRFDNRKPVRTYLLRPETVESFFVMWRLTKDQKYREWGWKVVQALELNCKVAGGYSGLYNVNIIKSSDDVQQSFFLAETLKYLYLLFSDDALLDSDQWVFNTEAHPLPVKGTNPFYRGHDLTGRKIVHLEL